MTIPSPSVLHFRLGYNAIKPIYPDIDVFFDDLAATYRQAIRAFYDAGCRYLQLDDTVWAYLCSEEQRAQAAARGDDVDRLQERYARTINKALEARPADMTITMHVCRGNFRSTWISSGGYEPVAETLLAELGIDGYFLEYDTERAGGFTCMKILSPARAGFLGSRLAAALLAGAPDLPAVSTLVAVDTAVGGIDDPRVQWRTGTIADERFTQSVVEDDVDLVYHLAAVVSGQAEAEFDLGMRVNVDATRALLDACRRLGKPPRFVFSSTLAVFGGPLPAVVPDDAAVVPQSSYGSEKAIAELLVHEYSRKRFVDGIVCRLPTVAIRPGAPNAAASSFVSSLVREPLAGIDTVCPVPLDTPLWIASPDTVIANLVHAARVRTSDLEPRRTVNFPGLSVTPGQMLDSLERVAGPAARARVRMSLDERVMQIVCTWPGTFDVSRALHLGFSADRDIDGIIRQFVAGRSRTAIVNAETGTQGDA